MPGPFAAGVAIGRFLFSGTQWFAGAAALESAIRESSMSMDDETFDFVCKYQDEIDEVLDLFNGRIKLAVNRAHWSAFSYGDVPSISEAVRVRSLVIAELNKNNFIGPALYALNYHKDYAVTRDLSGEDVSEPEGLWPGSHAQRERDFESGRFFHHVQPEFEEPSEYGGALWDGGTLMVSRPVCPSGRCHTRDTGSDRRTARNAGAHQEAEWAEFMAQRQRSMELLSLQRTGADHELGAEAPLGHPYYSIPPSWSESARQKSREWFADPFYGPTILRSMCGHMDARVLLVVCGALDPIFQNAASQTLIGGYDDIIFSFDAQWISDAQVTSAGRDVIGERNPEVLTRVAEMISRTGYNTQGTGILNLIADKNELTASNLPLESPLEGVTVSAWNGAYGLVDATLLGILPDAGYAGDQCGKDPCGI